MYLQHFGLKYEPLGKTIRETVPHQQFNTLKTKLDWSLQTKGLCLITGEAGVGKTTALRQWCNALNPMEYQVYYQADNHFNAFDIYSQLSDQLGLEKQHRYSTLWRTLKQNLLNLYDHKKITPIWILDEAHQLSTNFLMQLPSFLNYSFDTRDIMLIILVGLPRLQVAINRPIYSALTSRLTFHYQWQPLEDFAEFNDFIINAFKLAGCNHQIISNSGMKLVHMATKGRLRLAHQVLTLSMQLASRQNQNHLPDDAIESAITQLKEISRV